LTELPLINIREKRFMVDKRTFNDTLWYIWQVAT